MLDLVGQKLGKYEVTALLGTSSMAEVYKAKHPTLGREVAIKAFHPSLAEDETFVERFRQEVRLAATLRHPHILQIYDFDVTTAGNRAVLYVVTELAEGSTLKQRLEELRASGQTMPLPAVLGLLRALGSALDYAHGQGIVHGGIKPTNILFTAQGEPVLSDLGMARIMGTTLRALSRDATDTPAYMAPEQGRGDPVDGRADIYSLGVILYQLCTNRLPFTADTPAAMIMRHLTESPPPPSQINPGLPLAVERVILKALSKSPADRYQTAGEMVAALEEALAGIAPPAPQVEEITPAPVAAPPPEPKARPAVPVAPPSLIEEGAPLTAKPVEKEPKREGVRNLLIQILAVFTTVLALLEKFTKAVDIMRNPLIGLIVVGVGLAAMVISAGYVLARPQLYKRWQRRLAAAGLILTVLAAAGWGGWTLYDMKRPPKGLIVLIADFEHDPETRVVNYARCIETGLNEALSQLKVEGVYVERAYEVYTERNARARAAAHRAAVVIYGWYDDAGVNPRFELVRAPQQYLPFLKQTAVSLADLEQLEIRVDRELKEMNYIAAAAIGLAYYADGQNDQALTFFELALQSAPAEARLMGKEAVYFYKGSSHFYLHQFPQALAALQEAVRLNPDLYAARHNLAIAYSANCDYAAALQETEKALRLKPDSGDTCYFRGVLLTAENRWDEAATALARAAELSPDDPAIHSALGQAYEKLGRADEAAAEYQKATSLAEGALKEKADDPQAMAAHADTLWSQGKLEEAVAQYQQAIEVGAHGRAPLRPDRLAWFYRSLGRAYLDLERWTEAVDAYNQAIALSPGLFTDQVSLGLAYRHLGQPDQAVAAYQQALALLPCDANTHDLLGDLYRELGRTEEALQEYRAAVQYDPDDFTAWHAIGQLLEERGEAEEARTSYEKAITAAQSYLEHNRRDAAVTSMLGLMYLLLGDTRQAIPALQQAVALQPDADNHTALGNAYYEAGEYEKALAEYQAALAADPGHVASLARLGDTYNKLGRTDEAIAAYRRALTLEDDADVRCFLAMLLERQGQMDEAIAEYHASLRLEDNVLARLALASLYKRTDNPDQAIAEYQAALRLSDDAETHVALARLYETQGRLEEAVGEYRAAIVRFEPEGPYRDTNRAALASVLLRLCRLDEALAALQPSLEGEIKPSVEVLAALAAIYEAQGKTAEASEAYTALLQDAPDLPIVHYLAAWFAYRQDRLDEAVREMEQATKLAPAFSLAWSGLGYFYDLQGDLSAAKGAHEKALEILPSNVNALLGLGALALQQGNPSEALTRFQEALQQQPEYVKAMPDETESTLVEAHLDLALAYERLGRSEEATQELATMRQLAEAAAAALPSHPQARFQLAVACWLAGDMDKAEAAYAVAAQCNASLTGERWRVEERIQKLRGK
ncbi:MAG: tetratricopeptide repeat protein [Anaerolineae bacterium]|nr:tetratricopeptide repeat protein [Anaerolineae bacterium]